MADKYAHKYIRHHHRHMAQHITTHQYLSTDLHRHCFPQPPEKKKNIHLPLYVCLFLHPHPFKSNPGSQGIIPRRKCHRITSTAATTLQLLSSVHVIPQKYSKRYIQAGSLLSLFQPHHPWIIQLSDNAWSQLVRSFRQAASRQLPFSFKAPQAEQIRSPAQLRG